MTDTNILAERWLRDAAIELAAEWPDAFANPDPQTLRIHIGYAPGQQPVRSNLGAYAPAAMADDGIATIFLSPRVGDSKEALAILHHEMAHHSAALAGNRGYGRSYGRIARTIGLAGPLSATTPSAALLDRYDGLLADLGPYPHAAIDPDKRKRQTTRMLKHQCPRCGAIYRCAASTPAPLCDGGENHHMTTRTERDEPTTEEGV